MNKSPIVKWRHICKHNKTAIFLSSGYGQDNLNRFEFGRAALRDSSRDHILFAINCLISDISDPSHNVKVYQTCSADSFREVTGLEFDQIDTIPAGAVLVVGGRLTNKELK
jgi:hypothetical protein